MSVAPQEIHDKLLEARELMNTNGKHWYQGGWHNYNGSPGDPDYACCAAQAVINVTPSSGISPLRATVMVQLAEAIDSEALQRKLKDIDCLSSDENLATDLVIFFNDDENTTWGMVSRKFRHAARLALR